MDDLLVRRMIADPRPFALSAFANPNGSIVVVDPYRPAISPFHHLLELQARM
jgi:hypothetical protein